MHHDRLQILEAMRGLAAVWVVLHHADLSVAAFLQPIGNVPLISNGFLGVDFFFVLSGFIIAFSTDRTINAGGAFATYLRARTVRVYVPYLPIGVGILVLYWLMPDLSAAQRTPGVLTSLLLLPTNDPPALSVAWTLVHELIFYSVYGLAFVSRRLLQIVLAVWAIAIFSAYAADASLTRLESYFLSPLNLCFHLGVGVYYASLRSSERLIAHLAAIGGLVAILFVGSLGDPNRAVSAIAFACLVYAASSAQWRNARVWNGLALLGAASYSIYLVHNPTLSLVSRALRGVDPSTSPWMGIAVGCTVSIIVGLVYWFAFERQVLRLLRAKVRVKASPGLSVA